MSNWSSSFPRNLGTDRYLNESAFSTSSAVAGSSQVGGTVVTAAGVAKTVSVRLPDGFNAFNLTVSWKDAANNAGSITYRGGVRFLNGLIADPASGANGYALGAAYGSSMTSDPTPDLTTGQLFRIVMTQNTNAATVTYLLTYVNSDAKVL